MPTPLLIYAGATLPRCYASSVQVEGQTTAATKRRWRQIGVLAILSASALLGLGLGASQSRVEAAAVTAPPEQLQLPANAATEAELLVRLQPEPKPSQASLKALRRVPSDVRVSWLVQDLVTGEVRESQASYAPMIPASTTKLLTAAAVLSDLHGTNGWWSTELTLPANELGQATISRLTLRGSADPTLSLSNLEALAQQVAARGIEKVGEVALDESILDAASWKEALIETPITAFMPFDWLYERPATPQRAREQLHAALLAALEQAGVTVIQPDLQLANQKGKSSQSGEPEEGVASVQSGTPESILQATLRPSQNLLAEELLASVAARPDGAGTLASAGQRVANTLHAWGVETSGLHLADGSGLSRNNRISPRTLVDVLAHMYATGGYSAPYPDPLATFLANRNPYAEALAHAGIGGNKYGRGGTLATRMVGSGLDVRAKTGTLPGVSALAGYVVGKSGHPLAFAMLMNGPQTSPILELRAAQDEWVAAIAEQY